MKTGTTFSLDSRFCYSMGELGAWTSGTPVDDQTAYVVRAAQHHATFVSVYNEPDINGNTNRGGEIVHLFGSFVNDPGLTGLVIEACNQYGLRCDAVCVAPYQGIGNSSSLGNPPTAATVSVATATTGLSPGTYHVSYTWVDNVSGIETTSGSSEGTFTLSSGQAPTVTVAFPSSSYSATANIYLTAPGGSSGSETLYATGITSATNPVLLSSGSWTNGTTTQAAAVSPPASNLILNAVQACAATESHWPTSLAYKTPIPWSRAAYLDYFRHVLFYLQGPGTYNGPQGMLQEHIAYLKQYTVTSTVPQLVGYEGIVGSLMPGSICTGNDPNGMRLEAAATRDMFYDPAVYDAKMAFYWELQQQGMTLLSEFTLASPFYGAGSGAGTEIYCNATWNGQPAGHGDGTKAGNGQNITNVFWQNTQQVEDINNASVFLQAWQDWTDSTGPSSYTPFNWPIVRDRQQSAWQRSRRGRALILYGPRCAQARKAVVPAAPRWFPGLARSVRT